MARAPQAAPAALESPAVRRSRYLADLLAQTQQAPEQIRSGGELGARLLAQGIAQFGKNRADNAVAEENNARTKTQRAALAAALGVGASPAPSVAPQGPGNSVKPIQSPIAPIAPVDGSSLPPAMPAQAPMPSAQPAPQQSGVSGPMRAQIELLMAQGDLAGATELFGQYQQQQAMMANLPDELRNDPLYAWAAVNNPEALAESLGMRARPVTAAAGTRIVTSGPRPETSYNPLTAFEGRDIFQTQEGGGVKDIGDLRPTFGEEASLAQARTAQFAAERPQAVNTASGGLTTLIDAEGNPIRQIEGREDPARVAAREAAALATTQSQTRALQVAGNTRAAVARAREQNSGLSTGVLSGIIPLNQWRANLTGTIETIQANLSFNELAAMRAASPSGGALGSIAVKELELLGATVASLNQNQSPEEFARSLDVIDSAMERWEKAVQDAQTQSRVAPSGPSAGERDQAAPQVIYDPQGRPYVVRNGQWVPQ